MPLGSAYTIPSHIGWSVVGRRPRRVLPLWEQESVANNVGNHVGKLAVRVRVRSGQSGARLVISESLHTECTIGRAASTRAI